jgi:hypothetical protein
MKKKSNYYDFIAVGRMRYFCGEKKVTRCNLKIARTDASRTKLFSTFNLRNITFKRMDGYALPVRMMQPSEVHGWML